MIIYCKNDGHTESFPSSIPFGYSEDVVIYIPKVAHSLELRVNPPSGEYLQPIVASKANINTVEEETIFVLSLPPKVTATLAGRVDYQVVAYTPKGEMPFQRGSFNIQKGVPVEIPDTLDELSAYNFERLHQMLAGIGLNLDEIGGFVGVKQNLDTKAKTVVGAINELKNEWVDSGNGAPIDPNLELEGYAADAKVVGTKFKDISDTITNIDLQVKQNDEDIDVLIDRVDSLEDSHPVVGIEDITLTNTNGLLDTYTIYLSSGEEKTFTIKNGEPGTDGKGFSIARTYQSIEQMNASHADSSVEVGDFVLIANDNVEDPDNSKLYVKTESGYTYLTDLSGAQGIKGVGVKGFKKTSSYIENGRQVNEYTMEFTEGDPVVIKVSNGKDGASVYHGWNGTTLTITSASGTSSVDLKGEKGVAGTGIFDCYLNANKSYTDAEGRQIDIYDLRLTDGSTYELKVTNGKDGDGSGDALAGEVIIQDGYDCAQVINAISEYRKGKNLFFEIPIVDGEAEKCALIGINEIKCLLFFISNTYNEIVTVDYSGADYYLATVSFSPFIVELDDSLQDHTKAAPAEKVGTELNGIKQRIENVEEFNQATHTTLTDHASRIKSLEERPSGGSNIVIDPDLKNTGEAADAGAVGAEISEIYAQIDGLTGEVGEIGDAVANQGVLIAELSRTSKEYTDGKVAEIVNSAPETLNTLNELADALGQDPNFATTVANEIGSKVAKSDIVNNLTSSDSTKVLSAAQGKALADLIENIQSNGGSGGGTSSTKVNLLDRDSTGTDFNNAVNDYQFYKTPIIFLDDVDSCPMITFTGSDNDMTSPICYFLNGRTRQILEVIKYGNNVKVYITDLKYTVRAVFTEEEMDNVLSNAKDDNEGEVYQYLGSGGGGKYSIGSIYMVTRE